MSGNGEVHGISSDLIGLARPIGELVLLPGNPRRGDVAAVARSLGRFGQRKPITATPDGTVTAGNHTLQAAQSLGWTHIAVVVEDDDEQTAKAWALADNRTGDLGDYDMDALSLMLEELPEDLRVAASYDVFDVEEIVNAIGSGSGRPVDENPEVDVDGFEFDHQCPKCGFEF